MLERGFRDVFVTTSEEPIFLAIGVGRQLERIAQFCVDGATEAFYELGGAVDYFFWGLDAAAVGSLHQSWPIQWAFDPDSYDVSHCRAEESLELSEMLDAFNFELVHGRGALRFTVVTVLPLPAAYLRLKPSSLPHGLSSPERSTT